MATTCDQLIGGSEDVYDSIGVEEFCENFSGVIC